MWRRAEDVVKPALFPWLRHVWPPFFMVTRARKALKLAPKGIKKPCEAISNQPESLEVLQRCKANLDMPGT